MICSSVPVMPANISGVISWMWVTSIPICAAPSLMMAGRRPGSGMAFGSAAMGSAVSATASLSFLTSSSGNSCPPLMVTLLTPVTVSSSGMTSDSTNIFSSGNVMFDEEMLEMVIGRSLRLKFRIWVSAVSGSVVAETAVSISSTIAS